MGGLRYSIVTVLLTVALAAGCTTRTESSAPASESVEETEAPAPTSGTSPTTATAVVLHHVDINHYHDVNNHPNHNVDLFHVDVHHHHVDYRAVVDDPAGGTGGRPVRLHPGG